MNDDTESLRAENRQLKADVQRLRSDLDRLESRAALVSTLSHEGVWDWCMDTGEAYFSRRLLATLGYEEGEINETGAAFFELLHPEDGERVQAALTAHLEHRAPYDADFRMRAKDGRWVEVRARGQAQWDDQGKPVRMAGVQTDVTEHHARERERRHSEELIAIQSEIIRALGVPILQVWKGILCLPIIGVVDEERAANMTTALLDRVTQTPVRFAVLDLTGAEFRPETAQFFASMTRTLNLIGTQGVLCGISPHIARMLVEQQLDFGNQPTYRDLGDALQACLQQL